MDKKPRTEGHTLIEIAVVSGLMLMLMSSVYFVVVWGYEWYWDSSTSLEIRQEALLGMSRMNTELRETNMASFLYDVDSPSGIVFASPRDANGQITPTYDGKTQWNRMVSYFIRSAPNDQILVRIDDPLTTPSSRPPDPLGLSPARNVAYFDGLIGSAPRTVTRHIASLGVVTTTGTIGIAISCSLSSRYQYLIELKTVVSPRN